MSDMVGWDIGGAHLKAALLDGKGEIINILQLPCQLWRGLNQLESAIASALQAFKIKPGDVQHAVTMTGELVDLFPNRHTGVVEIAALVVKLLGKSTLFYASSHGFVTVERVSAYTVHIASTNWHASASALAMHVKDALLIDVGSTTTDIIAIEAGRVAEKGLSDASRMQADSLVYTGVVRTPVMALAQKLPFEDTETNVAAEYFATIADVYRLTGELRPESDMAETADGKGRSELESARRLARMVGHDAEDKPMQTWKSLANTCRTLQLNQIKAAVLKHLKPGVPMIGAGAGSFLVKALADDLGHDFKHVWEQISMRFAEQADLEVCFPAYAVAYLATKQ
ncbi:MAG TPA: hydantoinase/oxoprolinase family protein [Methylotenera sp.]|nr:hydantoinase/oxoprolinase family protein [Methylotenera sp.]HPV45849.1 hydantoinase/oxoprolinase family protein [Methylotenera sp.]